MNVLVLGGTGEGRRLAAALHGRQGRTSLEAEPREQPPDPQAPRSLVSTRMETPADVRVSPRRASTNPKALYHAIAIARP